MHILATAFWLVILTLGLAFVGFAFVRGIRHMRRSRYK